MGEADPSAWTKRTSMHEGGEDSSILTLFLPLPVALLRQPSGAEPRRCQAKVETIRPAVSPIDPEPLIVLGPQPDAILLNQCAAIVEDIAHLELWVGTKVRGVRQEAVRGPLKIGKYDSGPLTILLCRPITRSTGEASLDL